MVKNENIDDSAKIDQIGEEIMMKIIVEWQLDENKFHKVKIVASSGFNPSKCKVMASVNAPIDVIGTGSYLPDIWEETYATADIVEYNGNKSVKKGREFLFR